VDRQLDRIRRIRSSRSIAAVGWRRSRSDDIITTRCIVGATSGRDEDKCQNYRQQLEDSP
jgi:hypothetical protein